jgi:hypothetical protein
MIERGRDRRWSLRPSRAMISGELSWAFVAICFAWAGSSLPPFGDGYINRVLERHELDEIWPYVTSIPAIVLLMASLAELKWDWRRRWTPEFLERSAAVRSWANAGLLFSWAYILMMLLKIGFSGVLLMVAVGGVAFSGWFVWENRRVQRDYRKQRPTLADDPQG